MALIARLRDRQSGRVLEVHGSQPSLQVYTANFLSTGEWLTEFRGGCEIPTSDSWCDTRFVRMHGQWHGGPYLNGGLSIRLEGPCVGSGGHTHRGEIGVSCHVRAFPSGFTLPFYHRLTQTAASMSRAAHDMASSLPTYSMSNEVGRVLRARLGLWLLRSPSTPRGCVVPPVLIPPHADPADEPHVRHNAVCLETQHFPDAVNHEAWRDSVLLAPGASYRERARHVFGVDA